MTYNTIKIGDLVNKDTDGDGIPDWEEAIWGTDPTKKETTPGVLDSVTIEKLKFMQEMNQLGESSPTGTTQNNAKLTQTDKFSRELFATITSLNQSGAMDQATIDKISSSLAEQIKNSPQRKVYTLSDIKISTKDDAQAVKDYIAASKKINIKSSINYTVFDVLNKLTTSENNVDTSQLSKLDPIIEQLNKTISASLKIEVPQSLAVLHLNVINVMEKLTENISDVKLYDTDVIVALSAISQYNQNNETLKTVTTALSNAIDQKLKN